MLPIVQRELIVSARNKTTYRERVWFCFGILVTGSWLYAVLMKQSPGASAGRTLYLTLTGYLFLLAGTAGIRESSDALSSEKRNGTLGLLFLTDLKGWDVVLGKLSASGIRVTLNLLASFPLLAVPMLMGGIGMQEVVLTGLFVANTLFLSLATGLLASALLTDERRAASLSGLLMLLICLYPFILALVQYRWTGQWPPSPPYPHLAPWFAMTRMSGMLNRFTTADLACSWLLQQGLAWLFLWASAWILPKSWQEKAIRQSSWKFWQKNPGTGKTFEHRAFRLDRNPFFWLAGYWPTGISAVWGVILTTAVIWVVGLFKYGDEWRIIPPYVITILALHTTLKLWVASQSSLRLCRDRMSGALELILSTPLRVQEVVHGQLMAVWRDIRWPLMVVLAVDFLLLVDGATRAHEDFSPNERGRWVLVVLVGVVSLLGDLIALAWVSMWSAMIVHRVNQAPGMAAARIMGLPWGVFYLLLTSYALLGQRFGFGVNESDFATVVVVWVLISLATNLYFGIRSRRLILEQMRLKASERFAPSPVPFWVTIYRFFVPTGKGEN